MSLERPTSIPNHSPSRLSKPLLILLLTLAGFAVMGYHPGLEDDGIYLSAVKADLNPNLYPHDSAFFRLQTQATVFDTLIAGSVRLTRMPVPWAELAWQLLSLYTILWAAYSIAQRLFAEERARFAGVALLAMMFTLPVAGTALYLADQYLHPRNMATAVILLAVDRTLASRKWQAFGLLLAALALHPIMGAFGVSFCFFLALVLTDSIYMRLSSLLPRSRHARLAATLPLNWIFEPPTPEWRRALDTRTYYFLYQWTWYEWLGAIGPLVLFWLLWRWTSPERVLSEAKALVHHAAGSARLELCPDTNHSFDRVFPQPEKPAPFKTPGSPKHSLYGSASVEEYPLLARFSLALVLYGAFQQCVAMVLLAPAALVRVTPLQPMRYLDLEYVFLVLIAGGLLGKHVLGRSSWRWVLFLIVTSGAMFFAQRLLLPATEHLELPGRTSRNEWVQAFEWIRQNTPADAYFALDAGYLGVPGADYHSFRALAERSQLADELKDAAVVTQVPELAPRWAEEVDARAGWNRFHLIDFEELKSRFGVDWVLLSNPAPARLTCQWHNDRLSVCRIPAFQRATGP